MDENGPKTSNAIPDSGDPQQLVALGGKLASVGLGIGGALALLVFLRALYVALTGQKTVHHPPLAIARAAPGSLPSWRSSCLPQL